MCFIQQNRKYEKDKFKIVSKITKVNLFKRFYENNLFG